MTRVSKSQERRIKERQKQKQEHKINTLKKYIKHLVLE